MHQITAIFEDAKSIQFPARPNEIVYQAAYRAGITLEHDCLEGACGSCKALCTHGEFVIDDYSDEALMQSELDQGYTLLCKMTAKTPCVVELPYPSTFLSEKHAPQWLPATVTEVESVSSSVKRLVIRLQEGGIDFLPGQYVHMEVPGTDAVRSYSFANAPGSQELEFFMKVYPQGAMSDYLGERAAVGDVIRIKGPAGHFYLRAPKRPILMIAGGTGLAPMLSMLRSLSQATGLPPLRLSYGVNEASEFFGEAELQSLAAGLPLTVDRVAVSAQEWEGPVGHVTALLAPELLNGGDCDAYLCGPPPMIEAVTAWLRDNGLKADHIHAERFVTSS
ncbi:MAG: hypothetical protein JWQ23_245 [Herminiimonas sp.]|nr:hypothetical protein [Herminiimonas sp.]